MAFLFLVVAVVVISVVVGAIAQFLNKLNEAAAPPPRANGPRPANPAAGKDMDRFLAEIDRLRRKAAAEAGGEPPKPAPPRPAPRAEPVGRATPVAPVRDRDAEREREREQRRRERERGRTKPAPRPEPAPAPSRRIEQPAVPGTPPPAPPEDLPVAAVVSGPAVMTGVPAATRMTRLASRPRPGAKSDFAKNLTALLGSGQGAAMAVVLGEIFGPPKCKRHGGPGGRPA